MKYNFNKIIKIKTSIMKYDRIYIYIYSLNIELFS